ncbi:MAG: hypothetical protein KDI79_21825 [Anaerolineae bacterium]|nr:hypothetical protein [Anaerolineae bacterium]
MACWFPAQPIEAVQRFFKVGPSISDPVLLSFNKKILQPAPIPTLLEIMADSLRQMLNPTSLIIWLRQERFKVDPPSLLWIGRRPPPFIDTLEDRACYPSNSCRVSQIKSSAFKAALQQAGIVLVEPIMAYGDCLGWLGLGPPRYGSDYSVTKQHLLELVVCQSALALSNRRLQTELESSVTQLRRAYQQIIQAQENERRQLAETLHDETLQHLADVSVRLGLLSRQNVPCPTTLSDIQARLAKTDRSLRELVRGVHPAVLSDLGLVEAVIAYLETLPGNNIASTPRIELTVTGFGDERLVDARIELTLYRFIQNATSNALTHGRPQQININLWWDSASVGVAIKDDGCGTITTVEAAARAGHFGLLTMRERIEAFAGVFSFCSERGQGTHVTGRIPVGVSSPAAELVERFTFLS